MVGAAGSAYMINDAATILPRVVVAKARAYLAGAAADVAEVGKPFLKKSDSWFKNVFGLHSIHALKQIGVRTEGIQEVLPKFPVGDESIDHITKITRTLRAVRFHVQCTV